MGDFIGQSIKRVEDKRFTTGKGRFTDDIVLPRMTFASIVLSPHAHALIKNIDNYAVALIPYAGGEHNPFQQSVGDWLDENAVEPNDEYTHSFGFVNSDGELVGSTWSDSQDSMIGPFNWWRTSGELLGTNLTEIVMRVEGGEEGDELVSTMVLSSGTKNITHLYWWETTWDDVDGDGEFSIGDAWVVRTGQMGTHSGDYYVTFVRIGSCDWGWTVSDCPGGQDADSGHRV